MDPLTAVGLGIQGVGLLGQLFGKSEEDKAEEQRARRQRIVDATVARLLEQKKKAISEGVSRIGRQASGYAASARSAAAQRAAARGRTEDVESYILPIEEKTAKAGNEAMSNFVEGTNRTYDQYINQARMTGLEQDVQPYPDSPDWTDYAQTIGGGLTRYSLSQPSTPTENPEPIQEEAFTMEEPRQSFTRPEYDPTSWYQPERESPDSLQFQRNRRIRSIF